MKPLKVWTTGKTYKKNWDFWNDFIVCESDEDSFSLMIKSWEKKWEFSFLYYHEIDETIKFNK